MASGSIDLQDSTLAGRPIALTSEQKPVSAVDYAIFQSITTLRTYLLSGDYTAAQLDKMTKNDMVNAARIELGLNN